MLHIDPNKADADGITFDELNGLPDAERNLLVAREVVYCTEFEANGRTFGGTIIARDLAMAERIAFGRGLGEKILGSLVQSGTVP